MRRPHLLIYQGLPASGKTTEARKLVESGWVRINWDDLRESILGGYRRDSEEMVQKMSFDLASTSLKNGMSVVVDNTNMNRRTLDRWVGLAEDLDVEYSIDNSFCRVPVMQCIERDRQRANRRVGRHVIEMMALNYGGILNLEEKPLVLVDIDGTIADCSKRLAAASVSGKIDWDVFFRPDLIERDEPRQGIIDWVNAIFSSHEYKVCLVSARSQCTGKDTEDWLIANKVSYHHLFMPRRDNDHREDSFVKLEMLKKLQKDRIAWVIDDRPQVIRMWKSQCLKVFDVGEGKEF